MSPHSSDNNVSVLLKEYSAHGKVSTDLYDVQSGPVPNASSLKPNEVLVHVRYVSVDPYLRMRLSGVDGPYSRAFKVGHPISSHGVGEVIASTSSDYKEGDRVTGGAFPWSKYATFDVTPEVAKASGFSKLEGVLAKAPLEWHIGVLGMPSFTAWYGLNVIAQPKKGETIVVSAAAGAVGQAVVQLAKSLGLYVVAAAGSDEKVAYLKDELKADAVFNYKKVDSYSATLKGLCPRGIDIYFDNVGGEFLDAVLEHVNKNARIAACGAISQYQKEKGETYGIKNVMSVVGNEVRWEGFIIMYHYKSHYEAFVKDITERVKNGTFNYKLHISEGIETAPQAMVDMMSGKNFGKTCVKV
ncbi:hypothetical protein IWQ60_009157 [Tieghemiomyces parasiticus]|uniref:Enoyl reductase (ER) domain-containing protein n=1 Tax=Tieghemiomyces parasiticus TaxID=78921 RepID=A0A9W7ZV04_9FUNG|nr:hypothetical protein IWQ60_009157 [Tieghemiomyces parasiticus]